MNAHGGQKLVSGSMELEALSASRLLVLRFTAPTSLTGSHGRALVEALKLVRGEGLENFGLLADCKGATATDADYRTTTGDFFAQERIRARIALYNLGPVIRLVAEMFRVGIDLQLKTFADQERSRAWLRTQGVGA